MESEAERSAEGDATSDDRAEGRPGDTGDVVASRIPDADLLDRSAEEVAGLTLRPSASGGHGIPVLNPGFKTGETIGQGAMADILEANQKTLWRTVAIKTLKPDKRGPNDQKTFLAEAIATANLEHPNIIPVHDLVRDDSGHLQLVMKRVVGRTWKDLLHPETDADEAAADELELDDHLDILLKVCDAVAYAHSKGILHRDIKPENVMIGDFGEVLLMDWGCAVTYGDHRLTGMAHLTDLETISGTPNYIAPEMARGDDDRTGPWSDVYLLGGTLYELLTGESPHRGDTVREVLAEAARGQVEPPRHRNPARAMPDELVELCVAALEREVDRRIASATDFAGHLRAYRRHGEAYRLAEAARSQLKQAGSAESPAAGHHYRQAVACCEQALEMWPHRSIQMLAVRAFLESATHALTAGDHTAAGVDARAAARLADELDFGEQRMLAEQIEAQSHEPDEAADRRIARIEDQAKRIANLARQRRVAWAVAAVATVVAVAAVIIALVS